MWYDKYLKSYMHKNRICAIELVGNEKDLKQLTYGELGVEAELLAEEVERAFNGKVPQHEVIGIVIDNSGLDLLITIHGIWLAGGAYLYLDPKIPNTRLKFMIQNSGVKFIVTQERHLVNLSWLAESLSPHNFGIITYEDKRIQVISNPIFNNAPTTEHPSSNDFKRNGENLSYVMYTSGSTGLPKGVACTQKNLAYYCENIIPAIDLNSESIHLQFASPSFDIYIHDVFPTLLAGGKVALAPKILKTPGHILAKLIKDQAVTHICLAATVAGMTGEHAHELTSLKRVIIGGEPVLSNLAQKWISPGRKVFNAYGITETTVITTLYEITEVGSDSHVPVGKPLPGSNIYILNEDSDEERLTGYSGEVVITGSGVAKGYIPGPSAKKNKFITLERAVGKVNSFRTGDIGVLREDGTLNIIGRIDSEVKVRGVRIDLGEIENSILLSPDVDSCAVKLFSTTGSSGEGIEEKVLIAFVVWSKSRSIPESGNESVWQHLSTKLPNSMMPTQIVTLGELPLLPNSGKVDRGALQMPMPASNSDGVQSVKQSAIPDINESMSNKIYPTYDNWPLPSDSEIQKMTPIQILCRIFDSVLGLPAGSIHQEDNFYYFGGNSSKISQVLVYATKYLKIGAPGWVAFESATPTLLVNHWNQTIKDNIMHKQLCLKQKSTYSLPAAFRKTNSHSAGLQSVLLVGATGFLGSWILNLFLKKERVGNIFCIVRTDDGRNASAELRLISTFRMYSLPVPECFDDRIVILSGDISKPSLGLPAIKYKELCAEVGIVVNAAGDISYLQPYNGCYPANGEGTRQLLDFCGQTRIKCYHHISTLAVFGAEWVLLGVDNIGEDFDLDRTEKIMKFENGYVQTKWVAEGMVSHARRQGLPVNVYRPGFITGDSKNGVGNKKDLFCRMIRGCIQLGSYPDLPKYYWTAVPVDYVAGFIVDVVEAAAEDNDYTEKMGKIYHIAPSRETELSNNELFELISRIGSKNCFDIVLERQPLVRWLQALESIDRSNELYPLVSYLTKKVFYAQNTVLELQHKIAFIDCKTTCNFIKNTSGRDFPRLNENLVQLYLASLMKRTRRHSI